MTRKIPIRFPFLCLLAIMQFALSACVSVPKLKSGEPLTQELIDAYNQAVTDAMSKKNPRTASGSKEPSVIARVAVLKYDRRHVHLFGQRVRQANYDYHNGFITGEEWYRRYSKLLIDRGVIPNAKYRSKNDRYLLKLQGDHTLDEASIEILKRLHGRWWTSKELTVPRIQIAKNKLRTRGINYHTHNLTLIDPPAIHLRAARLLLDKTDALNAVALHEAAHAVHRQLLGKTANKQITGKLRALSKAAGGWTNFRSAREVTEFLADAVEVQHGATAVKFAASRLIRSGSRIGSLIKSIDGKTEVLRHPHDASALFIQRLIIEQQRRSPPADGDNKVDQIRVDGQQNANDKRLMLPNTDWMKSRWVPFVEETFTVAMVNQIQQDYAKALDSMFSVLLEPDT